MGTEDVKNLSIANLLNTMANKTSDPDTQNAVGNLLQMANVLGITNKAVGELGLF